MRTSRRATEISPDQPVLVDRFIDDAVEIDVDALYDGTDLFIGGVMEHIEEAGIHSGDSSCALPPITLGAAEIRRIREATGYREGHRRARAANIQYALGPTSSTSSRRTRGPAAPFRSCRRQPQRSSRRPQRG